MGELAARVREFLPSADIRFQAETGGRAISGNFLIDNRRLIEEFGVQYRPLRQRVREVINDIRAGEGLPLIVQRGGPSYSVANGRLKPSRSRRGSTSCTK